METTNKRMGLGAWFLSSRTQDTATSLRKSVKSCILGELHSVAFQFSHTRKRTFQRSVPDTKKPLPQPLKTHCDQSSARTRWLLLAALAEHAEPLGTHIMGQSPATVRQEARYTGITSALVQGENECLAVTKPPWDLSLVTVSISAPGESCRPNCPRV